ncbi:MAG: MFS transporter [Dehalococcoidia bacterium]
MIDSETLETRPLSYRWVVMLTFTVTHATALMGALVLGILLPAMTDDLGLSPSEQGWLGSSALIGSLIFSLPFGWWLSRYRPKRIITVALAASAFFVFVQGWAPIFAVLLVGRLLFGLTAVARDPARALLIRQWLSKREIPLFNGILNAAFGLLLTAGFVVTPLVLKAFDDDWRNTLYSYAILNAVMALAWFLLGREKIVRRDSGRAASQEGTPLRSLFRYREPWLVGLGMVGYSMAQMAQFTFWPTFMKDTYGMSLVVSGFLIGVLGLVVAGGGLVIVPVLAKRAGNRLPLMVIGIGMGATFLGILATESIPILVAVLVVNGLARGAFWTIFNNIPFEIPARTPREIAITQALMQTMFWGGGVLGPILVGFIQEITGELEIGMVVAGLCPLAVTLTALFLPGKPRPQSLEAQRRGVQP